MLLRSVGIVEPSEPESANIGGESPLSNPDWVLEVSSARGLSFVVIAGVLDILDWWVVEGLVEMMVHGDILNVIILEKIIPVVNIKME